MDYISKIKQKAKEDIKTIILPETQDIRILEATHAILKEGFSNIILLGDPADIIKRAKDANLNIDKAVIINPKDSDKLDQYTDSLYELRKEKGMTKQQARNLLVENSRYYATMMVKEDDADGFVSGAVYPTCDTLKPALQIIKGAPGVKTVSAFFVMVLPDKDYGEEGVFVFSDCGMNSNPNEEELSEIAIESAKSFQLLVEKEPKVAMLSYSTLGSAKSELIQKVINATNLAKEKRPDMLIDGEMQLDAAIVPEIGKRKAPDSKVAGNANILIFPDLNAGNIGYKLVQRLAKAEAYGPLCQGLDKPVNDLSRGCSSQDIAGVVALTCLQAQNMKNK